MTEQLTAKKKKKKVIKFKIKKEKKNHFVTRNSSRPSFTLPFVIKRECQPKGHEQSFIYI